ncbi:MAG: hypothetical protein A2086_14285 [Spirochaetes bacterium GWD1_27_9]|nr:MAG: hypothetical protein A2Z98_02020 [Spirochaetes bacterium GWB1_27_13]OHD20151.1 MAG: hypothetical protein A2Y34_12650 [Spirochaetes bacterium GWC1_27_15]OHD33125.1 MAG: hypothetical protein A2086_14285 [Spirochaetes bacterium GWD1_27_9]
MLIGFANFDTKDKKIFNYHDVKGEPVELKVENINPYLVNQKDFVLQSRTTPICNVSQISFGSMPNDEGNFLFTDQEKNEFLEKEPDAEKFFKLLISAKEFLNNENRWCLWLVDIKPSEIKSLPMVAKRIENVKNYRLQSTREATKKLADYPYLFGEIRQPNSDYILIPRVTSENRYYIPMAFFTKDYIVSDSCLAVPNATFYEFGILMSSIHMAWVRQVCGRLKSDYRYSNNLVYNNFPWPETPDFNKYSKVEEGAKEVLAVREEYKSEKLADLYDPISMPKKLVDAHKKLDKAVDLCYRPQPFTSELGRIEFLFDLYEKYTSLFKENKKKK